MIIAICDDDKKITDYIESSINSEFGKQIHTKSFNVLKDLENAILKNEIPDTIIMDICVKEENGIDTLRKIRKYIPNIPVIFITGYTEYCQDIFIDFNPWGLLTKPIDNKVLFYYINKIINQFNLGKPSLIKISVQGQNISIDKSKIIYLESRERKVTYHTVTDNYEEYIKLDVAMNKLDNSFLRCHKSYTVNLKYAAKLSKSKIILTNGESIPVSRSHCENAKKRFFDYKALKMGL